MVTDLFSLAPALQARATCHSYSCLDVATLPDSILTRFFLTHFAIWETIWRPELSSSQLFLFYQGASGGMASTCENTSPVEFHALPVRVMEKGF